jgi:hypothetical protein
MTAPPAKPRLESGLLTNNAPDIQRRLDACLNVDPMHFLPGTSGPHIALIQMALGQVRDILDKRIPEIKDKRGFYGPDTIRAVHIYKETRDIVIPGHKLDDIVGRRTISFLDDDLVEIEGSKPAPKPPATKFKDVVVRISGFGGINSPVQGQPQLPGGLIQDVVSGNYRQKSHRSIEAIVFTGGQRPDPSRTIAGLVRAAILGSGASVGIVCLVGESAGGKNVLALANDLAFTPPRIPLTYVGVSDGAFDDGDAVAPPNSNGDNLEIRAPFFGASEKVNIFQSDGNGTEFSGSLLRSIWAGKMPNKEVHGRIQGFVRNRDLTADGTLPRAGANASFEAVHANAVSIGNGVHLPRIRALLDAAP